MDFRPSRSAAEENLNNFLNNGLFNYSKLRNFDFGPDKRTNISCLSPYISHGVINELEVINGSLKKIRLLKMKNLFRRYFGEFIGKDGWS